MYSLIDEVIEAINRGEIPPENRKILMEVPPFAQKSFINKAKILKPSELSALVKVPYHRGKA